MLLILGFNCSLALFKTITFFFNQRAWDVTLAKVTEKVTVKVTGMADEALTIQKEAMAKVEAEKAAINALP